MEMPELAVSVVMPTYNHARFIAEAIESVLAQTYKNFELIIIDNCSTDNTEAIVRSYSDTDPRIRYQKFRNNGIIAVSRNVGIRIAAGTYVAFIDSDDSWFQEKLEKVVKFLARFPDTDLLCHDENYVSGVDKKIMKIRRYGPYKKYEDFLFKDNPLSTSAVVVRRSKLLEAGLFSEAENLVTAEDYELWLRLSKRCRIEYLHEVLGNWRVHETSLSGNLEKHTANVLNAVNHHFEQWPRKSFYYKYLMNKRRGAIIRGAGRNFIKAGKFAPAKPYLHRAFRTDPFSMKTWILCGACMAGIRI